MNVLLQNFGCKVNAAETESIATLLLQNGWERTADPAQADAVIINSCTVTASGDKRMMHAIRKLRRQAPDAVFLLTGCYVQAFPEDAAAIPDVDIIIGTKERSRIPELLQQYRQSPGFLNAYQAFQAGDAFESLPQGADPAHTRAFLKIQDGCNRFCSYCIIPYARGRCRSRPLEEIRAEAEKAAHYREIVLCGINLACYGMGSVLTIADAVRAVADAGIPRIRLGSLEPDGLTEAVLEQLQAIPGFLPHFHISVQSGCDRILQAMHRNYTCADYAQLIQSIRKLFPGCAVTTDMMTGFPGETEQDFEETLRFAERIAFSEMHLFRYSVRPGTPAATMPEQIPAQVSRQRADKLSELSERLHAQYLRSCLGKTFQVLFERQKSPAYHQGHAENYVMVRVPAEPGEQLRGCIRPVQVTGICDGQLLGRLVTDEVQQTSCEMQFCMQKKS